MRYVSPLAFLIACLCVAPHARAAQSEKAKAPAASSARAPAAVVDSKAENEDDPAVKSAMSRDVDSVLGEMQSALEQVESAEENSGL